MVSDEHDQGVAVPGFKASLKAHGRPAHAAFAARERDDAGQLQGDACDRVAAHDQVAGQREELSLAAVDGREAAPIHAFDGCDARDVCTLRFGPGPECRFRRRQGCRPGKRGRRQGCPPCCPPCHHRVAMEAALNARSRSVRSNPGAGLRVSPQLGPGRAQRASGL